jgi:5-formyltetrahydrofolate cyclo-ligase
MDLKDGLDLVIMPGLAFDRDRNRIGYGKGYYDTFLERLCKLSSERGLPDTKTVAVGISSQLVDSVPVDTFDRKPDVILLGQPSGQVLLLS